MEEALSGRRIRLCGPRNSTLRSVRKWHRWRMVNAGAGCRQRSYLEVQIKTFIFQIKRIR